jgi:hypothetical protein
MLWLAQINEMLHKCMVFEWLLVSIVPKLGGANRNGEQWNS